jgi:hypothetical protein
VQDEDEGCDELLNRLSAENEMRIEGVKSNLLFQNYCATTSTWAYKYSEIFENRNMKD